MTTFIIEVIHEGKKGYFTGNGFDTNKKIAKEYQLRSFATHDKRNLEMKYKSSYFQIITINNKKKIKPKLRRFKKNPIGKSEKIEQARKLYRDFKGHTPTHLSVFRGRDKKEEVGIEIGNVLGVMYETVRDGKKTRYLHKFKFKSRPILYSTYNGSSIGFIGGKYEFTERGIVDK